MAEIVSQEQRFAAGRRRWIEVLAVIVVGAAITIVISWAAFAASTATVITQTETPAEYLQEPGLLDQRSGERGVVDAAVSGGTLLDPGLLDQRSGERGVDAAVPGGMTFDPGLQVHRRGEREGN